MRRIVALLTLTSAAAGLAVTVPARAADLPAADAAKGQEIATKTCAACHGADGNSPTPANPKLASQTAEYLQKQLTNFKAAAGKKAERESPIMAGMAAPLSADDMRNVAAYYSGQAQKPGAAKSKETLALGRKIWRGGDVSRGLPACAACHGAVGAGVPAQYPRLAGQYSEYTEAQLKGFRSGARANDANKARKRSRPWQTMPPACTEARSHTTVGRVARPRWAASSSQFRREHVPLRTRSDDPVPPLPE
jgi:cytochrome c553